MFICDEESAMFMVLLDLRFSLIFAHLLTFPRSRCLHCLFLSNIDRMRCLLCFWMCSRVKKIKIVQKEVKKRIKITENLHSKLSKSPLIRPPPQGGVTTHYVSIKDASVPEKLYLYCNWEGPDKQPAAP